MRKEEWLANVHPALMLDFFSGQASERKLRLLAVACCREFWDDIRDERGRKAVVAAELYADGMATSSQLQAAATEALALEDPGRSPVERAAALVAIGDAPLAVEHTLGFTSRVEAVILPDLFLWWRQKDHMRNYSLKILRDIFGNPFRPATVDPSWATSSVVALAAGIYEDRAFDRFPLLADALENAGCDSADILDHLRGDGPHVRGCWALDLILGKS